MHLMTMVEFIDDEASRGIRLGPSISTGGISNAWDHMIDDMYCIHQGILHRHQDRRSYCKGGGAQRSNSDPIFFIE